MIAGMSRNAAGRPTSSTHVPWPGLRRPVRLVLLAADADPDNRAVVDRAIAIAIREHAELVAVHILPADQGLPLDAGDGPVPPELDRIVLRARAAGAKARHLVRSGDTGPAILDAARRLNADVIVMGGDGACGHVLAHSDRPVLVVQSWAEADPAWDDPFLQDQAQPPLASETAKGVASAPSVSQQEAGEQTIPVMNDRVACRLLGEVELDRCLECGHLIRLEPGPPGSSTARQVICLDRGPSLGDDLSW